MLHPAPPLAGLVILSNSPLLSNLSLSRSAKAGQDLAMPGKDHDRAWAMDRAAPPLSLQALSVACKSHWGRAAPWPGCSCMGGPGAEHQWLTLVHTFSLPKPT